MSAYNPDSSEKHLSEQEYVAALEREFLRLRGKAILLGPSDWELACDWFHRGIPLELVLEEMKRLFERQRERKSRRGISSLRYFRAAVEAAWAELERVRAGGYIGHALAPLNIPKELERLQQELPEDLPERMRWLSRLQILQQEPTASAQEVEAKLEEMEHTLLEELFRGLSDSDRLEVEASVSRLLARVRQDVAESDQEAIRKTIERQVLRKRFSLPRFTLFSAGS
jgi:hypothetical protein